MAFNYHLITNVGTLINSELAMRYPNTLALAHIYDNHQLYRRALKGKMALGHRIILDNGAHEGIDIDLAMYAKVINDLVPTVAVMTDLVGRPAAESREQSFKLVPLLDDHTVPCKLMYVPQGISVPDVLKEYVWAIENLSPQEYIIGFGQGYLQWVQKPGDESKESTRRPMIDAVMTHPLAHTHEFHVLGARWSADHSNYNRFKNIIGIDTIKPVTCAASNLLYPNRPKHRCLDREGYDAVPDEAIKENIHSFCHHYGCEHGL